ncbi:MAG: hypothetical protein ABJO36_06155 [Litorimonas sp.]
MISISIANSSFRNKTGLKEYLSDELQARNGLDVIDDAELASVLIALFMSRAHKVAELGERTIVQWEVKPNQNGVKEHQCFAALLSDSSRIHMSYHKAVDAYCGEPSAEDRQ